MSKIKCVNYAHTVLQIQPHTDTVYIYVHLVHYGCYYSIHTYVCTYVCIQQFVLRTSSIYYSYSNYARITNMVTINN